MCHRAYGRTCDTDVYRLHLGYVLGPFPPSAVSCTSGRAALLSAAGCTSMVFCGPSCFNPFRAGSAEILAAYGGRVQAVHTLRICAVLLCFIGWLTSFSSGVVRCTCVAVVFFSMAALAAAEPYPFGSGGPCKCRPWLYMGAAVI